VNCFSLSKQAGHGGLGSVCMPVAPISSAKPVSTSMLHQSFGLLIHVIRSRICGWHIASVGHWLQCVGILCLLVTAILFVSIPFSSMPSFSLHPYVLVMDSSLYPFSSLWVCSWTRLSQQLTCCNTEKDKSTSTQAKLIRSFSLER